MSSRTTSTAACLLILCTLSRAQVVALDTVHDASNLRYGVAGRPGHGLDHGYFYVEYNDTLRVPNWVAYHLSRKNLSGRAVRRNDFHEDEWLHPEEVRSLRKDYVGSGFDKGHLAPAQDFTRSKKAMSTSFLMSNMSPQYHATNAGVWARLEAAVRTMVRDDGEAWIVSGNAFLPAKGETTRWIIRKGEKRVAIPTHLFKALLTLDAESSWTEYAFLVPNSRVSLRKPPRDFLVAVDTLETKTGLDFFPLLDDSIEDRLESRKAAVWPW